MSLLRLLCSQRLRQLPTSNYGSFLRRLSAQSPVAEHPGETQKRENLAISHARFVAEAGQKEDWPEGQVKSSNGKVERDVQATRQGRLLPTSSHLFKLVLPLPGLQPVASANEDSSSAGATSRPNLSSSESPKTDSSPPPPTVFLLHPSQPLSHIARLIQAALPLPTDGPQSFNPRLPTVSFQNSAHEDSKRVQWSDSTDIGDFVRDAAHTREFQIIITPDRQRNTAKLVDYSYSQEKSDSYEPLEISVTVPTFEDRTRYLRRRLDRLSGELKGMQELKDQCDALAKKSARRLATGGFGILVSYWILVFRLTFYSDYGWDTMEPVTYLTEFLFILAGYVWFLRQGREVSYSSILHQSLSTRRRALYASKGLDIERWADLVTEQKAIEKEIERIREDYEGGWKEKSSKSSTTKSEKSGQEQEGKLQLDAEGDRQAEPLLTTGERKEMEAARDLKEDVAVEGKREKVVEDERQRA